MLDLESKYKAIRGKDSEDEFVDELFSLQDQGKKIDVVLSKFYSERIKNYSPEDNIGYIHNAVQYALLSEDRSGVVAYLRQMVDDPERFKDLGTLLGGAATMLGGLVQYPDQSLAAALSYHSESRDDWDVDSLRRFANRAFGAYIATATDFEYGLKVANDMDSAGTPPTVEQAEQIIAQWQKNHSDHQ